MSGNDAASGGLPRETESVWLATTDETDYQPLEDGLHVDTAVVGGGIAGIATAYALAEAGQAVAVLERDRIVTGVTGHTTAKLTSLHGLVYDRLLDHFGEEKARQYAEANQDAIDTVETVADALDVDCGFERTPAYTYTESDDETEAMRDEAEAASRLDLPASYTESTDLPYDVAGAVRFDDQAVFHPRTYLVALAREVHGGESHVFERTRATDVEGGTPCRVSTDRGEVTAEDVVLATHFPIHDHAFYYARMYPKRSYVLDVRLGDAVPEGTYYDPDEPYFSVRPRPAGDEQTTLVGGQNHRTGHGGNTTDRYRRLAEYARDRFDVEAVEYRWSTQDYVSVDGVPFVGEHSPGADHLYVATGFGGWGMTNGVAAGTVLADRILGRGNPWSDVYRPTRFDFDASRDDILEHNKHAMSHFFRDRLQSEPHGRVADVERGTGAVIEVDGDPVGVYHDEEGEYHVVSAVCTHMGCHVEWNDAEASWDCPCHGSRFDHDGSVLDTPAVEDLERYSSEDPPSLGDDGE